jgi:hypothetical protein
MTQLDDMDFIAVRIQHERRDPNSHFNAEQDRAAVQTNGFIAADSIRRAERSLKLNPK